MFHFDYITKEGTKEHNPKWPEISDHPYQMLIIGGPGSGKANALLGLVNHEPDIDKISSYAKAPSEATYQSLITNYRLNVFKWFKSFCRIFKWYGWCL